MIKNYDLVLLQETWIFEAQIGILKDLEKGINFAGKGVDKYDPLPPQYLPRGFGGVAVIWKLEIDNIIKPIDEGRERLQCIELKASEGRRMLIISAYLPATGSPNHAFEYKDTVDQLYEICQKYQNTHEILIGGDLNEDLGNNDRTNVRKDYLLQFIDELGFTYSNTGKTFVKINGEECSELDYFLCKLTTPTTKKRLLKDIISNTSDHYPITMEVEQAVLKNSKATKTSQQGTHPTIKWDKVDKDMYSALVQDRVEGMLNSHDNAKLPTDKVIQGLHKILQDAANISRSIKSIYKSSPKLKVWTPAIKNALQKARLHYKNWAEVGKPRDPTNTLYQNKLKAKREFRRQVRIEQARKRDIEKEKIMETRTKDSKLFHQLVKSNRTNNCTLQEINVGTECYEGDHVIEGFKRHFSDLATPPDSTNLGDQPYHENVEYEVRIIAELVQSRQIPLVSMEELAKSIKTINKGKSGDIYGITIEHIIHGGSNLMILLQILINSIITQGEIPDQLKTGLLTPIFKNKGDKHHASNYRGITVLPVISKIIEAILKERINPKVLDNQNPIQRGFTANSSPMNAALPLEEMYREAKDNNQTYELVLLDAKSAFDVVIHSHLLRRLFHAGVDDQQWLLIRSMHTNAMSAIKWDGGVSANFKVSKGVRQGGILSTDLYKLYVNPLLNRLEQSALGCKIGNILCNATACADDVALLSTNQIDMQVQVNMSNDFAKMEGYKLQPQKSVSIKINPTKSNKPVEKHEYNLNSERMPNVEKATHLGIIRTNSWKENEDANVQENIKKARRSAYALFGCGFHGENGLDPETTIHLYKTYILPVLLYGMELITPKTRNLELLELFQKKMLKHLLSLPTNTPDPALNILTGILPVEAQIDTKILTFFSNICDQPDGSLEKRLAMRQLQFKTMNSSSWFIEAQRCIMKYSLGDATDWLNDGKTKSMRSLQIKHAIYGHWMDKIKTVATLYDGLKYLNITSFKPGRIHQMLTHKCHHAGDIMRIPTKLKLLTGTYILQPRRFKIYEEGHKDLCGACSEEKETTEHLLVECSAWETQRENALNYISDLWNENSHVRWEHLDVKNKCQVLLDVSKLQHRKTPKEVLEQIEYHSRRMIYRIHQARSKLILKK